MEDVYLSILKKYWGYDGFRGIQREIIESIGNGRDTLGLMPTGGGKSITFQVPALSRDGICIVVTPLIALMKDQVRNLRGRGIKAAAVYSGLSREEILVTLENCIFGNYKFLYVSPERLASDIFLAKVRHMPVSFLTVDEAHCISQWGYDFRPSYTRIAEIRKILPDIPVLALTATATPEVVKDIQRQLAFREENAFRMSFERKNLAYIVRHTEDKFGELIHILNSTKGSAIVYTRSRRNTRETTEKLQAAGMSATFYHAGLNDAEGKPVILLQKREVAEVSVNDLNGAWEIVSVKGNPVGEVEKQPQLVFNVAEKRVHGNASCNTINGSFTQEEGQAASLRFSQMISTMMACPNMDVESSILKALDEVRSFEIKSDGTVSLLGADGAEVLSLKKLAETEAEA